MNKSLIHTLLTLSLAVVPFAVLAESEPPDVSLDGLELVEKDRRGEIYADPGVDWSVYDEIQLDRATVSFRKNWQRDQNRSSTRNISTRDMERIKADVATLFERVFSERLEAAGYPVVDVMGDDVLLLRPAIIDLDVTAPDLNTAGRTRNFTASTGAATLYIELYDSVTGDILGRAADRQSVRNAGGNISWSNSVSNMADANRMIGRWADRLVGFLQNQYK